MSKPVRLWIRKAAFLSGYFAGATRVAVQPVGLQHQQSPIQSTADPRPSIAQKLARVLQSHGAVSKNNSLRPQTQSHDDSEQSAALNAYLRNGNEVHNNNCN